MVMAKKVGNELNEWRKENLFSVELESEDRRYDNSFGSGKDFFNGSGLKGNAFVILIRECTEQKIIS